MAINKSTKHATNPKTIPIDFDNVQGLKEYAFLEVGDKVRTLGYYSVGDLGGNAYEIVAAGTGTDDGGSFIDLSGSGLQAKGLFIEGANVKQFGARGSGSDDDTIPLQAYFDNGGGWLPSETYLYSYLDISADVSISGRGVLRYDGSAPVSGLSSIQFNGSVDADVIYIESPGGAVDQATDYAHFNSSGIKITLLSLSADTKRDAGGGVNFYGSDIDIGSIRSTGVKRPVGFNSASGKTSNIFVGDVSIRDYVRGLVFNDSIGFVLGSLNCRAGWPEETFGPGKNAILIQNCSDFSIGDIYAENAVEHSVRIGGDETVSNFTIGDVTTLNSNGCSVKFNAGIACRDFIVGNVLAINTAQGNSSGNREVIRLSKCADGQFGNITATVNCTRILILAASSRVTFGDCVGESVAARALEVKEQDGTTDSVNDISISSLSANMAGAFAAVGFGLPISNIKISGGALNNVTNLLTFGAGATPSGILYLKTHTDSVGVIDSAPSGQQYVADITDASGFRYVGAMDAVSLTTNLSLSSSGFDPSTTSSDKGTVFVMSNNDASEGNYGGGIAFSRLGSSVRRGAGIAIKQTGASERENGIAFFRQGTGATASDIVFESMLLKHDGVLNVSDLPTYADDSAAGSGGLVAGDMYKTSSGEVRIKL